MGSVHTAGFDPLFEQFRLETGVVEILDGAARSSAAGAGAGTGAGTRTGAGAGTVRAA